MGWLVTNYLFFSNFRFLDCQKEEKLRREQEEAYTTHKYLTEQIAWAETMQNMLDQKEAKKAAELRELKEFNLQVIETL